MKEALQTVRDVRKEADELREVAVHSCHDASSAVRMAKAFVLLREAECILDMEARKIEDGVMSRSEMAQAALGWNLNSVRGRIVMAREILDGQRK